jgi:hypothetical protein
MPDFSDEKVRELMDWCIERIGDRPCREEYLDFVEYVRTLKAKLEMHIAEESHLTKPKSVKSCITCKHSKRLIKDSLVSTSYNICSLTNLARQQGTLSCNDICYTGSMCSLWEAKEL